MIQIIKESLNLLLICWEMKWFQSISIGFLFIWGGAVLAISFMEAPLKFTAPDITVELGLGIGRVIFHALNKLELFFAFSIVLSFVFIEVKQVHRLLLGWIVFILLYETLVLLPQLDERAELLLSGNPPPASYHHWLYIILDFLKVSGLFFLGFRLIIYKLKGYDTSRNIS